MKNLILIITAFILVSINAEAQDYRDRLQFGVKFGTNNSNVYDSEGEEFDADAKFGFVAGTFICIPIGEYLGVQPEFLFAQKGFQATGNILGSTYQFTRTTSYFEIPIYVTLKPSPFITIMAGPQYSYLLQQTDVFGTATTTVEQETEFLNDDLRKNLLGFTLGLDLNLNHFVVGGRFGFDFQKNNVDGTSTTPRYKNVWLQATIGYKFFNN